MLQRSPARDLYLCCYDISDDGARQQVHHLVNLYATQGQKSAYPCFLTAAERERLRQQATPYLSPGDSLVIQPISHHEEIIVLGLAVKPATTSFIYIE